MARLKDVQDALWVLNETVERLDDLGVKVEVTVSTDTLSGLLDEAVEEVEAAESIAVLPRLTALMRESSPFTAPVLDERGRKIKDIQNFLSSRGIYSGSWFTNLAGIPPHTVNKVWKMVMASVADDREAEKTLKALTRGDRFANINQDEEWDW